MKIVSFKGQHRITLPKNLVEDKGWKAGTGNTGSTAPSIIPPYYKLAFICKL